MSREVNKCPACGALRPALAAQCPECGYDFHDSSCKVVMDLNAKLDSLSSRGIGSIGIKSKQIEIIKAFAIPHIKEEILDLLYYIQPKAMEKNSEITKVWRQRQREVIQRAKTAFANDAAVLSKVNEYEVALDKIEKQWFRQWWQKTSLMGKIVLVVGVLFLLVLIIPAKDISPEAYALRFIDAVENAKYDKALSYLKKSPEMNSSISDYYLTLIDELFADNRYAEAEMLFNNMSRYVSASENKTHLSSTSCLFIQHYLKQQYYDMAEKFVVDANGIALILKELITKNDVEVAKRYFRKHQSKLTKYDSKLRKRVLELKDDVIEKFLVENNLI